MAESFRRATHVDPTTGQRRDASPRIPGGIAEKTAGGFNPLSLLGGGNPYWRGAIAAGGVLTPTPAETGEFNRPESDGCRATRLLMSRRPMERPPQRRDSILTCLGPTLGLRPLPRRPPPRPRQFASNRTLARMALLLQPSPTVRSQRSTIAPTLDRTSATVARLSQPATDLSHLFGGGQPHARRRSAHHRAARPGATCASQPDATAAATPRAAPVIEVPAKGGGY